MNPQIFLDVAAKYRAAGYRFDLDDAIGIYLDAAKCGRGWVGMKGKCKRSKAVREMSTADKKSWATEIKSANSKEERVALANQIRKERGLAEVGAGKIPPKTTAKKEEKPTKPKAEAKPDKPVPEKIPPKVEPKPENKPDVAKKPETPPEIKIGGTTPIRSMAEFEANIIHALKENGDNITTVQNLKDFIGDRASNKAFVAGMKKLAAERKIIAHNRGKFIKLPSQDQPEKKKRKPAPKPTTAAQKAAAEKLPPGTEISGDKHGGGIYSFKVGELLVDMTIQRGSKNKPLKVDFSIKAGEGAIDFNDEDAKGDRASALKGVQRVMDYHAAMSPDGTPFMNDPVSDDPAFSTRVRSYERGGYSQPLHGDQGEMFAKVQDGKLVPDIEKLEAARRKKGISEQTVLLGRARVEAQKAENRAARIEKRKPRMVKGVDELPKGTKLAEGSKNPRLENEDLWF